MNYSINTPTFLFPALSLLMLAYTNRFSSISQVIRRLHECLEKDIDNNCFYMNQISSLKERMHLVVGAQRYGTISLMLCVISMVTMIGPEKISIGFFFSALLALFISLFYILKEINISQDALDYIIDDCKTLIKK